MKCNSCGAIVSKKLSNCDFCGEPIQNKEDENILPLDNSNKISANDANTAIAITEFFQTYGFLCRELGMPIAYTISSDLEYNEVDKNLQEDIRSLIGNELLVAIYLNTQTFYCEDLNDYNIEELISWEGNASIISTHGFYNVNSDGVDLSLAETNAFTPWAAFFNQMNGGFYSHVETQGGGPVFWLGDDANVLLLGSYMNNRPTSEVWDGYTDEWNDLITQFETMKQLIS